MSETNLPIKKWEKVPEKRISYDSNTGEKREDVSRWIAVKDENQGLPVNVCLVHESPLLSKEEIEANENMIAAAPCMLETLDRVLSVLLDLDQDHLNRREEQMVCEAIQDIEAVLAKARGE